MNDLRTPPVESDTDSGRVPVVLVVDDDPTILMLARISLENAGFAVEEREDGPSALAAFDELKPDLLLLDVMMPGMDGFEVCREIRRRPGGAHFPIVMATGLEDTKSIDQAYEAGATDFITKPINPDILGYRVRYILRSSEAEAEVANAHGLLKDAIESIPADFRLFDAQDRLLMVNSRAQDYFPDLSDRMIAGATYEDIVREVAERRMILEAREDPEAWVAERMRLHRSLPASFEQQRSDGKWVKVFERQTSDGGTVAVRVDITELKEREAALEEARIRAETADKAKTEFLANMSHELRTPLNAVIGFADLFCTEAMGPLGHPDYVNFANDIRDAGKHLLQVISDILDMSKISAGKLTLNEETVSIGDTVSTCVRMIQDRAKESNIAVTSAIPSDLPTFRADPRLFKQMILNLLSNAVKFSEPEGQVGVSAECMADGAIVISIKDHGIGIAAENIPAVLAPFGQVDGSFQRAYEGTGLGLPLTKAMVELHDGRLDIASEEGVGTNAMLVFPPDRTGDKSRSSDPEPARAASAG